MKSNRPYALAAILGAVILTTWPLVGQPPDKKPTPEKKEDQKSVSRVINLWSIYSTIHQDDGVMKPVTGDSKESHSEVLSEMLHNWGLGASNVFLVYADDIKEAITATKFVLLHCGSADVPTPPPDGEWRPRPLWLVVYFGTTGSSPSAWLVDPVEQHGTTLRVPYWKPENRIRSKDAHPYFLWAPLGKLEAGTYQLELYNMRRKEVTLLRLVTVPAK